MSVYFDYVFLNCSLKIDIVNVNITYTCKLYYFVHVSTVNDNTIRQSHGILNLLQLSVYKVTFFGQEPQIHLLKCTMPNAFV